MLNDCGKDLFKPWLSVPNVLLLLAVLFGIALFKLTSSELASWVQAVGSIAAIWGALKISQAQQSHSQRLRLSESMSMAESHLLLVKRAGEQCAVIAFAVDLPSQPIDFKLYLSGHPKQLFRITLNLVESISIREIGSPLMMSLHLQICAAMAQMYEAIQAVSEANDDEFEKINSLMIRIRHNNNWYQGILEGFENAFKEKLASVSNFK